MNRHDATVATSMQEPDRNLDLLATKVLDAAFIVHRELGPGLLENIYETCLCDVMAQDFGLKVERQKAMPVAFRGKVFDSGYRLDIVVENSIVLEIKSCERLADIHQAQIMTYMKLSGIQLGFLLNFNAPMMKQGIKRFYINQTRGDRGVVAV